MPAQTILFVTKTSEFGGAERHLIELASRLAGGKLRLSILCLEKDFYSKRLSRDLVEIISETGEPESFWDWFRLFRRTRPNVLVFVRANLWWYPWHVPFVAWLSGVPRRVSIAHLPPPLVPAKSDFRSFRSMVSRCRQIWNLLKWRISAVFENATVCVSNAIRNSLLEDYRFPANKTITIHNGVPLLDCEHQKAPSDVRTKLNLGQDEFILLCLARLSEQKRIDILLLAMARLVRDGISCKCIIVGDGPLREVLQKQTSALGLVGHVFFEGFQEDIDSYLRASTAFVLTSDREGLPLSILEAMAWGLPCIVTNVGGNAEVVTHGIHGLIVRSGADDEIAQAIAYLVTHPGRCHEMSKLAQKRVRQEFNIEEKMAELKKVILGGNLNIRNSSN